MRTLSRLLGVRKKQLFYLVLSIIIISILLIIKNVYSDSGGGEEEQSTSHSLVLQRIPKPKTEEKQVRQVIKQIINPHPNYCAHVFYYMWWGNPEHDDQWVHWNHRFLSHWDPNTAKQYPQGTHEPPDDLGSSFYPELGPYSSKDPEVIDTHMQQIRDADIGVVVVSWYPQGLGDENGKPVDPLIPVLLDKAHEYSLKVALHIEPYAGRSARTVLKDIEYLHRHYASHPAYFKISVSGKDALPVVYIYDSYKTPASDWAEIFSHRGFLSIRGTKNDIVAVSLFVHKDHESLVTKGGFNGFYTYFTTDRFSFGSSLKNWKYLSEFASRNRLLFIPSVGPGYDDSQVRPWNQVNWRNRESGMYYTRSFKAAISLRPRFLSISTFNEWHEGTQIEPAVPKEREDGDAYLDYSPADSDYYLQQTAENLQHFQCTYYL